MRATVRCLNDAGIQSMQSWLKNGGDPPTALLLDSLYTEEFDGGNFELDLETTHSTSFELGRYLAKEVFVGKFDPIVVAQANGLWSWISLAYIASLVRRSGSNAGTPLDSHHYVQSTNRLGYRLIARTAWQLVRLYGEDAIVALNSKKSPWGEMAEQMTSRLELFNNPAVWPVARILYLNADGSIRRGATSQRSAAARKDPKSAAGLGGIRRLPHTFRQFERTYNLRRMSASQIIELLPAEYRPWLDQSPSSSN